MLGTGIGAGALGLTLGAGAGAGIAGRCSILGAGAGIVCRPPPPPPFIPPPPPPPPGLPPGAIAGGCAWGLVCGCCGLFVTGAGLGTRLANTIRSQTFPKSGESLDAAWIGDWVERIVGRDDPRHRRLLEALASTA